MVAVGLNTPERMATEMAGAPILTCKGLDLFFATRFVE